MTFQSVEYILFFSLVFILYWTICSKNKNHQNGLLVLSSLFFYGYWDWRFLGLLLFTAFTTYYAGILLEKNDDKKKRKLISTLSIVINLLILFYYKYYNFFIQSFIDSFSTFGLGELNFSTLKIILPVGISFYTFTALSYSIDIYQRKSNATKDILAYLAYVTFFPSILSGPISRAQKQLPQYYQKRIFDYDNAIEACKYILIGAMMKLCLADRIGIYVDSVYANIIQHNGTTLLFTSVLYSVQIYADFAGYSLMAIGSGKLLGINLPENFNRPYFAKTVSEFWRKWHISLTTWFRDYIYFPLGGNKVSNARWMMNTMIVFVTSGLWHGAAYTYIIWGFIHGVCMIVERLLYGEKIKQIKDSLSIMNLLRMLMTFIIVTFAWIFFRAESLQDAILIIQKIFTSTGNIFMDKSTLLLAFVSLLLVIAYDITKEYNIKLHLLDSKNVFVRYITAIFMICYIIAFGVLNGGSFIYFQF